MRCPQCHHENVVGARFCGGCGVRLESVCPACGAAHPAGNRFCQGCGVPLSEVPLPTRFASPQVYTPKHLATKILTFKSTLEDERKQVTILFADLQGSMELLADRDPEEARRLLDPVLERMMDAVHRYEGTVNQVMGDGIMALFGAPVAHEDHAVRAGYAALRMQEAIGAHAEELKRRYDITVQIRIGLNSGEVVVRGIDNDLRMDYSAIGQSTHLAARMEQLAAPGTILVTEAFVHLTEGYLHFKPLGLVPVKGLAEPVDVFQLVDAEPTRSRFQAAAARGLTRFAGRQGELTALAKALEQAGRGQGQALAVIGEPGVGKSRLFYEFVDSPRTRDWSVLETGAVSYGKIHSYEPVRGLLRTYFQLEDRDDAAGIRDKVARKLLTLDPTLPATLPALLAVLDVPVEDPAWHALDPFHRRQRMLEGIKRLLLGQSRIRPLLMVFENLHWIDPETQALLDSLIDSLPTARILLLVNYRPEYQHGWGSRTYYTQLRLDPLPPETAEALLEGLLGADPELRPLKELLIERTEGNPFFLEESIRTLVETKVLVGTRGACRLARALQGIQVPATVHAILAARIDRLPPEEKRLLQCAAVIGKDVSFTLLAAITDLSESELGRGIAHLQTAEFVYETSLFPELEYTFKHALTHEVAYGSLLHDKRRGLHARIVSAIEALHAERLPSLSERLAHHAFGGEDWEKALTYSRQAGSKAMARSAYREAVAWLEQGLQALAHLPERRNVLEQAVDLRLDLRNSLLPLGEHQRILDRLSEAEKVAISLGDQRRAGWVSANTARQLVLLGDPERAVQVAEHARSLAVAQRDFPLEITATSVLGQARYAEGGYVRGADVLRRNVAALEGERGRDRLGMAGLPSVTSRTFLVFCLAELGEFREAELRGEEAVQLAEAADHAYSLAHALFGVGHVCLRKGELDRAMDVLERGMRACDEKDIRFARTRTVSSLGYAYALSGRVSVGLPLLKRGVEEAETMHVRYSHALWLTWLAEGQLLARQTDEAGPLAERALAVARSHGERGHEAWALRLIGEVCATGEGTVEAAAAAYGQAMALAIELGMRPLQGHCERGLGLLHRKAGRLDEARRHLESSAELFEALGMGYWRSRAADSLGSL
jgi:class 3 adenylate cyclase/tetratricopeptide (TPR) repeat protein